MYDNYERNTSTEWEETPYNAQEPNDEDWQTVTNNRTKKTSNASRAPPQESTNAGRPRYNANHQFSARRREVRGAVGPFAAVAAPQSSVNTRAEQLTVTRPSSIDTRAAFPSRVVPSSEITRVEQSARVPVPCDLPTTRHENQAPSDEIRIPRELMRHNNRAYQTIVQGMGAFVRPITPGSYTVGIWGPPQAVQNARHALLTWIEASGGNHSHKEFFPTTNSLTPLQRQKEERAWDRDVTRHARRFRPPQNMSFSAIGAFHWPADEFPPREVFGPNLERIDPIRAKSSCSIIWEEERASFQVMAERNAADVQAALKKLRGAVFQLRARGHPTIHKHLIFWTAEQTGIPSNVMLEAYCPPKPTVAVSGTQPSSYTLRAAGSVNRDHEQVSQQTSTSRRGAKEALLNKLATLHYRQGPVQLRVHFGVFIATRYKKPSQPFKFTKDEIDKLISGAEFRGRVTQELGDLAVENSLPRLIRSSVGIFDALDPSLQDLSEVQPTYSATFDFAKTSVGDIRLEVTWDEGSERGPGQQKWYITDNQTRELLDLNLINLSTTHAWHIAINSPQILSESRIPPQMKLFATTISPVSPSSTTGPVMYGSCKSLTSCQIRAHYRYLFANSDFILEVTRFTDKHFHFNPPRLYESRWGVSIYRTEWDAMFTQNENLEIGARAKWSDEEEVWFPADTGYNAPENGNGWEQLIDKMGKVEELVHGRGNMYGGMQVV